LQRQIYDLCLQSITDHLEDEVIHAIEEALGPKRELSIRQICGFLRANYANITRASISEISALLDVPYVSGAGLTVKEFIASHVAIHYQLNRINAVRYGFKPSQQIAKLQAALEHCQEFDSELETTDTHFRDLGMDDPSSSPGTPSSRKTSRANSVARQLAWLATPTLLRP